MFSPGSIIYLHSFLASLYLSFFSLVNLHWIRRERWIIRVSSCEQHFSTTRRLFSHTKTDWSTNSKIIMVEFNCEKFLPRLFFGVHLWNIFTILYEFGSVLFILCSTADNDEDYELYGDWDVSSSAQNTISYTFDVI